MFKPDVPQAEAIAPSLSSTLPLVSQKRKVKVEKVKASPPAFAPQEKFVIVISDRQQKLFEIPCKINKERTIAGTVANAIDVAKNVLLVMMNPDNDEVQATLRSKVGDSFVEELAMLHQDPETGFSIEVPWLLVRLKHKGEWVKYRLDDGRVTRVELASSAAARDRAAAIKGIGFERLESVPC